MRPLATLLFSAGLLMGCGLDYSGSPGDGRLGMRDSGPGGPDGAGRDAGPRDGAGGCTPDTSWCEGEVSVRCFDGDARRQDCRGSGAHCDPDPTSGVATCFPDHCAAGTVWCSSDGLSAFTCDARGASQMDVPCPSGCDPATGRCSGAPPPPACAHPSTELLPGSAARFDTCSGGNNYSHEPSGSCFLPVSNGGDKLFHFTLTAESGVYLDLRDDDVRRAINTILYLRGTCDDVGSQLACSDDIPCSESDFSCLGYQPRQSRIHTTLPPGTYYVIADSHEGLGWDCGSVRLEFSLR